MAGGQTGAKVVVLDKAEFPRDKPCGDGLTARAVSDLQEMGLAEEVDEFHRVNPVTVFSPSQWELSFPKRPGMPDHDYVAPRPQLDTLLLKHAEAAGAEIRQSCEVTCPELDATGRVVGVVIKGGEKVYGDAVIAADGACSPIERPLKIDSEYNGYSAIAIRAEMQAEWDLPPIEALKKNKIVRAWQLPMDFTTSGRGGEQRDQADRQRLLSRSSARGDVQEGARSATPRGEVGS
jgi:flavin-dependent dehydrogenase